MKLAYDTRVRLGRSSAATSVLLALSGAAALLALGRWDVLVETDAIYFAMLGLGFGGLTWVMIPAQADNGAVWALAWASLFAALFTAGLASAIVLSRESFPDLDLASLRELSPSELPLGAAVALSFRFWAPVPALWLPLTLGLLLFPEGRPPTRRWAWVGWWSAAAITVGTLATAAAHHPWSTIPVKAADDTLEGTIGAVIDNAFLLASLSAVASLASLVVRYRRSTGPTRSQILWIASGGALFLAALVIGPMLDDAGGNRVVSALIGVAAFSALTLSFGVAITKHRLYEIDTIISKSVTYLGLAAAISTLYAAIVVVPLLIVGVPDEGGPGLALPIAATAVVAVLFERIRVRMQRWANRLVYGNRATPHEVLSQLTARLSQTGTDGGTRDLARLLVEGTGADHAIVWLGAGDGLEPEAVWQADDSSTRGPISQVGLDDDEFSASVPVRHGDDQLGAVSITKPRNDPITPADRELLADVAAGAGLVLRNLTLNRELEARAREVRESRRRLIAAQDAERHRLERDLHDGAQQQVVALKVKLGLAKAIAQREGADDIADLVDGLAASTQDAVDAMRAVAHGIYPPLLEAEGLDVALTALARPSGGALTLDADGIGRLSRRIEQTAFFCVREAAQGAQMAGAREVHVGLSMVNGELVITITHDAPSSNGDVSVTADRIDAIGGSVAVSHPAVTTTVVTCRIPTDEHALQPT